ncbi:low affinity immunoglobulin gamma Fc region receptor III-A-like [Stegostoma tigrinum]|uniref:low affinity immunoglobulin gamma Fc region receptor III-A-like n=1 Tax=Stegostoma tigrinum TaxID=3053191 RepID=UPI0028701BE7|nr:low affinity immunoglobulin gamma Fc region receptor III-A-like [Stegostoma tigrinum]
MIVQIQEGSSTETGTPVLTLEPMWRRFLTGDWIILRCDAGRELHSVRYKWFVNNNIKEFSEKIYTIEAAGIEHNGEYRCQTLTQTTADSNSILVRVSVPVSCPSISSDLKEPAVSIGDHFPIRCTSENGTLPINLMLYHDHHPHPLRNTTVVDSRTATFHVTVPPDGEGAAYSCGAANAVAHVINCSEPLVLTVSGPTGKFALQVGGSAVAAVLLIVFLLLFAVCKLHHKERHQDTSGSQSRRDTSSPNHDEIVYSVVQAKKKEGGSVRTRREPQESDSRVTYASLMYLETPKVREASARGEEENGSSIYQNFQRR